MKGPRYSIGDRVNLYTRDDSVLSGTVARTRKVAEDHWQHEMEWDPGQTQGIGWYSEWMLSQTPQMKRESVLRRLGV